jgi:hypothetical protein
VMMLELDFVVVARPDHGLQADRGNLEVVCYLTPVRSRTRCVEHGRSVVDFVRLQCQVEYH